MGGSSRDGGGEKRKDRSSNVQEGGVELASSPEPAGLIESNTTQAERRALQRVIKTAERGGAERGVAERGGAGGGEIERG